MTGGTGLRRFTSPPPEAPPGTTAPGTTAPGTTASGTTAPGTAAERCALCAAAIPGEHGHVADVEQAALLCACRACYLLFTHPQAGRGRYRSVPDRYLCDPADPLTLAEWEALQIPVSLAFFLRSSGSGAVTAFYPSPAGATECMLDVRAWTELATAHPLLAAAEPDVEAILVSRAESGVECFCVPVDACYELAGRMRLLWRGFDGGTEAKASIASFVADVRRRARPLAGRS